MAKDKISDYSSTANSNTDIAGINIDEGCAPSGINDAIRTLMAQLKTWQSGGQDVYIHPAGSASAPSITANGDTNTGIFFPAADTVGIATGGSERLRVDSSGNLGVGLTPSGNFMLEAGSTTAAGRSFKLMTLTGGFSGGNYPFFGYNFRSTTTSGTYRYDGNDAASAINFSGGIAFNVAASGTAGNAITWNTAMALTADSNLLIGATSQAYPTSGYKLGLQSGGSQTFLSIAKSGQTLDSGGMTLGLDASASYLNIRENIPLTFGTNNTERARIDSSGNLLVGATDTNDSSTGFKYNNTKDGAGHPRLVLSDSGTTNSYVPLGVYSTGASAYRFYVGAGGTVYATSTTITAISSDARLKQDIVDYDKGLSEVLSLRPRYFAYKTEPDIKLAGFISQEVQTVMPEAIEPTLEDPEMMTYSIDWHPLLVKAIQEQQAIIETLTARITALEQA